MANLTRCNVSEMSDNLYRDNDTGDLVMMKAGVEVARFTASGWDISGTEARGQIIRRSATVWECHDAKTAAQLVAGDGADVKSMPVTTDVTLTHAAGSLVAKLADLFRIRGVTSDATAGAYTYLAAGMKLGLYLRDPAGASRSDVTDTAANIIAAIPESATGSFIDFAVVNVADAEETVTLTAGAGVTLEPTVPTIARYQAGHFRAVKTGAATVTVYQMNDRAKIVQDLGSQAVGFFDS